MREHRRLKLVISYDGRGFAGWQSQKHGNTIQDKIESAFAKICAARIGVIGAGRTDAGVHALGQCAHADVPAQVRSAAEWLRALNGTLPLTIRILRAQFVPETFHARFSARGKLYRYRVVNTAVCSPFEIGQVWHVPQPLDLGVLQRCGELFIGRHDFAGFAANRGRPETNTVRTIEMVRVAARGGGVAIEFGGEGFLYKMVRMMVGAMVRCALQRISLTEVRKRLSAPACATHHFVAPAEGLFLVKVRYS